MQSIHFISERIFHWREARPLDAIPNLATWWLLIEQEALGRTEAGFQAHEPNGRAVGGPSGLSDLTYELFFQFFW